jgi:adenylate cyclase
MLSTIKRFLAASLLGFSVACLGIAIHQAGWIEVAELKSLDYRFRQYADSKQAHPDIVLVTVDEASLEAIGRWPWHRDLHGYAVEFLKAAGAKVIVFDILFLEPDQSDPEFDDVFAHAIGQAGNVFLPTLFQGETVAPSSEILSKASVPIDWRSPLRRSLFYVHPGLKAPIPALALSAKGLGFINLSPDRDGTTRRVPIIGGMKNIDLPALATVVAKSLGHARDLSVDSESFRLGNTSVPVMPDGRLLINWHGSLDDATYKTYSMGAVVHSALRMKRGEPPLIQPEVFKDKIVFVATNAAGTYELRVTPLSPTTPGVLIHMAMLDDLLQGRFMKAAPPWTVIVSTIALCLLTAWSLTLIHSLHIKIVMVFAIAMIYTALAIIEFTHAQWWIEMVLPLGAQGVTFATVTTVEYFTEGRKRRQLRIIFDKYMSAEVVDEILLHPEAVVLGGEKREMTVLFSDIEGFTGISEQLSPEQLVQFLNLYLSAMTTTIRTNRGNVNKYLGDGIMAMFGAPLKDTNHASLACFAALAMHAQLEPLRETWVAEGYPHISARIGISTGPLVVGNVGSSERMEYTVIGDTVNLASRLEGANKFYQTHILIGPRTYELAKNDIEARPVDVLRVKGRKEPIIAYELLGRAGELNAMRQELLTTFREGFEAYRARQFARAHECFHHILSQDPLDTSAAIFLDRTKNYLREPPPVDWDGVFDLQSK